MMYVCASKASVQQSGGQSFYVKIPNIGQKQGKKDGQMRYRGFD